MSKTLGFVVEGSTDRDILDVLVERLAPQLRRRFIRIGGRLAQRHAHEAAARLLGAQCERVIILLDADVTDPRSVEKRRREFETALQRAGINDDVSVCLAVPEIESWLLATYEEDPDKEPHPKTGLARARNGWSPADARQEAERLDLGLARRRSPSLDEFVRTVEAFASR